MSLLGTFARSWVTAEQISRGADLRGKLALVTGANSGIGAETARVLALRGADVVMACRDAERAERARQRLVRAGAPADRLQLRLLDLGRLESVAAFAEAFADSYERLDLLILNAGVVSPRRAETADGHELHFGVNHLGHFLLTLRLLSALQASGGARVVFVSSDAMHLATLDPQLSDVQWQQRPYAGWVSYGDSKLMNLLTSCELNLRYRARGITSNAVHPGVIPTNLVSEPDLETTLLALRALPQLRGVGQGAASSLYAAVHPDAAPGGDYFAWCRPHRPHPFVQDETVRERLWASSEDLVADYLPQ